MTNEKRLEIRNRPYWVGGTKVCIDGKDFYMKYQGYPLDEAKSRAENLIRSAGGLERTSFWEIKSSFTVNSW